MSKLIKMTRAERSQHPRHARVRNTCVLKSHVTSNIYYDGFPSVLPAFFVLLYLSRARLHAGGANKFRDDSKMNERQAKRDWRWQFKTVVRRTI